MLMIRFPCRATSTDLFGEAIYGNVACAAAECLRSDMRRLMNNALHERREFCRIASSKFEQAVQNCVCTERGPCIQHRMSQFWLRTCCNFQAGSV